MAGSIGSWTEALKDRHSIGFDIETTGTQASTSSIYNVGLGITEYPNGKVTQKATDFYIKDVIPRGLKTQEEVYAALHAAHKTPGAKRFALEQEKRGVFKNYSDAYLDNKLVPLDKAYSAFSQEVAKRKKAGGAYIIGQNVNFENLMLKEARKRERGQRLSASAIRKYNRATGRSELRNSGKDLFKEYKKIEELTKKGQTPLAAIKNLMAHGLDHTDSQVQSLLKELDTANSNVMSKYKSMIKGSKSTVPVVDLLHVTQALYTKAVIAGDLDIHKMGHGASLDFLSRQLLGKSELHLGSQDSLDTEEIFRKLVKELDAYDGDKKYSSPLVKNLNKAFDEEDVIHKTFLRNLKNKIEEATVEGKTDHLKARVGTSLLSYSHILEGKERREKDVAGVLKALEEESPAKAMEYLEGLEANKENTSTKAAIKSNMLSSAIATVKKHKIKVGAAVGLAAVGLFSGGDSDDGPSYNTYDELYNDMYLGSPFADWQERNGAHKLYY